MFNFAKIAFAAVLLLSTDVFANVYPIPPADESLVGQVKYTTAGSNDTVVTVAKRYNLGFNALEQANPQLAITKAFPSDASLTLPTQHLLPNLTRQGIIINLPEMRMYYFLTNGKVLTYPIGIGKIGKTIPITNASITRKTEHPTWMPPESIREFNLQQGVILPQVMPAGPDNPLGNHAIYMTIPTFLIHSTIFPESVGKRASFGCIRMYETDIKEFFPIVDKGVPVVILNAPAKLGWQQKKLYMEVHPPLEEHSSAPEATLPGMTHMINAMTKDHDVLVDWQSVAYLAKERDGLPHDIGMKLSS